MKQEEEGREESADCQEHQRDALPVDYLFNDCATPAAAGPGCRRRVGEGGLLNATGLAHGECICHYSLISLKLVSGDIIT